MPPSVERSGHEPFTFVQRRLTQPQAQRLGQQSPVLRTGGARSVPAAARTTRRRAVYLQCTEPSHEPGQQPMKYLPNVDQRQETNKIALTGATIRAQFGGSTTAHPEIRHS